jgi:hypothetical protein
LNVGLLFLSSFTFHLSAYRLRGLIILKARS